MTIRIRRARGDEAELCWRIRNLAIIAQCQACYPLSAIRAWTPEKMPDGYRQAILHNPFYVAENMQHQLLASGYLDIETQRVEAMFTLPEAMRQGIAARIMTCIKQEALARGINTLALSSTPNAQGFYLKQGFRHVRNDTHYSPAADYTFDCIEMLYRPEQ
ncbi:GNAT family N-acetyltransferase [Tatumella sp. OPLPL6]|uniref:GNAT family N-acetyltransferase n=1 Tax=Tatumella sp. OPLPL6 TaxID=1928657 RepID=UPI000C178E92|nr:GNAT family N-acetyltransferase [Tatumella sp. OPLPL6]